MNIKKLNLPPGVEAVLVELLGRIEALEAVAHAPQPVITTDDLAALNRRLSGLQVDVAESLNHTGMH